MTSLLTTILRGFSWTRSLDSIVSSPAFQNAISVIVAFSISRQLCQKNRRVGQVILTPDNSGSKFFLSILVTLRIA